MACLLLQLRASFLLLLLAGALVHASSASLSPCGNATFVHSLAKLQLVDASMTTDSSPTACLASCCHHTCVAWQYHVSTTDPSHHPNVCWHVYSGTPKVRDADESDVWVGGSAVYPSGGGTGSGGTGGGGEIQPISMWNYYGASGNLPHTLLRTLTDQSIKLLHARADAVAALGSDRSAWTARKASVLDAFGRTGAGPFAPYPPPNRTAPKYTVTKTLRRPGYTCDLVLYETRPGFYATGSIWTPAGLKASGQKAPGVLMVSGHTPDGFRSNNLGGNPSDNDGPDDDYQVVEINLVSRGFVVLAFDPIGQGERMQYADIPVGRPDPSKPWGAGAPGAYLWSSTADHEYIGRQLLLNGVGLMSFWLHDEMISIDLLESLPHVDEHNLGVVGCSGGGTQSSYLGAMDPRIKAASMACYTFVDTTRSSLPTLLGFTQTTNFGC